MPGRPKLWDAKRVEQEFVTSDLSVRELARRNSVAFSSMAKHARDNDWQGKRVAYKAAISRRGYEAMAAEIASQEGIIREESVLVMRATLRKYAERLAAGDVAVTTKDAVEAVRTIAFLLGEPSSGSRDPDNARTVSKPDADHLRRVAEAARRQLSGSVVLEGTAEPGEPRTRVN
jgi:hypothetical protein